MGMAGSWLRLGGPLIVDSGGGDGDGGRREEVEMQTGSDRH